jgi:ubiquinone/menaquinone biosynthesis C-methylase UbiE
VDVPVSAVFRSFGSLSRMSTPSAQSSTIKDLWSASAQYRAECQTADDIDTTLRLLDLASATTLADVGCGNGAFSIAAARAFGHLKVLAYDALESAIAQYQGAAADILARGQITAGIAPAENMPIASSAVDRVLCRAVLHHIADPRLLYNEIARILKPEGELLLQAPCNYWPAEWSAFMSEFYMLMDSSHPRQYHTPARIIAALSNAGLLMHRADCWTYTMYDVNDEQRALISRHDAARRLCLRQGADGRWAVDFYWVRILARKG